MLGVQIHRPPRLHRFFGAMAGYFDLVPLRDRTLQCDRLFRTHPAGMRPAAPGFFSTFSRVPYLIELSFALVAQHNYGCFFLPGRAF